MRGHECPVCVRSDVPMFRFCCNRCFRSMPILMRRHGVIAWRERITKPVSYAEAVAGIALWYRDYTVDHQERQRGERE
jgi:hypothetical protein